LAVCDFNTGNPNDIVVTAQSRVGSGLAEVILLPEQVDGNGNYAGYGAPVVLATESKAGQIVAGDFGNGATDLAVTDTGGVEVIYGAPLTLPSVTNLGSSVHLATQTHAITSAYPSADFTYTVPTEAAAGAGQQIVDISAQFQHIQGAGLSMTVSLAGGAVTVLQSYVSSTGIRYRVLVDQGSTLAIHVASNDNGTTGFGAYTLDIDVLPQVVSAQAQSPLPGDPLTSIVLTLQGDRLDPASAENPSNYTVYQLGADGNPVGSPIPLAQTVGLEPVVYDDSDNLQVATGRAFPTAVRQTITLYFDKPLTAGASYLVALAPSIQTASLGPLEAGTLAGASTFGAHPLVGMPNGIYQIGTQVKMNALVQPGSLNQLTTGTDFMTQLHDDLGAQLDQQLTALGDSPLIPSILTEQVILSMLPGWLAGGGKTPLLILWLDPVSIQLADPGANRAVFDLQSNSLVNQMARTFIEVGGSVEVMVIAALSGTYNLQVSDVQAEARGEAVMLDNGVVQTVAMTDAMRSGDRDFQFTFPAEFTLATAPSPATTVEASIVNELGNTFTVQFNNLTTPSAFTVLAEEAAAEFAEVTLVSLLLQGPQLVSVGTPPGRNEFIREVLRDVAEAIFPGVPVQGVVEQFINNVMEAPVLRLMRGVGNNHTLPQPQPMPMPMPEESESEETQASRPEENVLPAGELVVMADVPCDADLQPPTGKLSALFAVSLLTVGAFYLDRFDADEQQRQAGSRLAS
jgi:hypothetical protein